jgi:hypothetical protein
MSRDVTRDLFAWRLRSCSGRPKPVPTAQTSNSFGKKTLAMAGGGGMVAPVLVHSPQELASGSDVVLH